MMNLRISILAVLCLALLAGCAGALPPMPKYILVINPSQSNEAQISSPEFDRVVRMVIANAKLSTLDVVIAAEDPMRINYAKLNELSVEKLRGDILKAREEQVQRAESQKGAADAKGDPSWGEGTDHGSAFAKVLELQSATQPTVLIALTDGFNEQHPLDEITSALTQLVNKGPIHIIVLGLSQGLLPDESKKTTVLDFWEHALQEAGATSLTEDHAAPRGYFASSQTAVDRKFLLPFAVKQ